MKNHDFEKIIDYLRTVFPKQYKISDICKTYEELSTDKSNHRCLVHTQKKAINFDRLTEWLNDVYNTNVQSKSADALTFVTNQIDLIEFKTGDQDKLEWRREALLTNVRGKIADSATTIHELIFDKIPDIARDNIDLNFFLVVDADAMKANVLVNPMIQLSEGSSIFKEEKVKKMLNDLLGKFSTQDNTLSRYKRVDIWYSNLFDWYLDIEGIQDLSLA